MNYNKNSEPNSKTRTSIQFNDCRRHRRYCCCCRFVVFRCSHYLASSQCQTFFFIIAFHCILVTGVLMDFFLAMYFGSVLFNFFFCCSSKSTVILQFVCVLLCASCDGAKGMHMFNSLWDWSVRGQQKARKTENSLNSNYYTATHPKHWLRKRCKSSINMLFWIRLLGILKRMLMTTHDFWCYQFSADVSKYPNKLRSQKLYIA